MRKIFIIGKVDGKSTLLDVEDHMKEKTSPDTNSFYYGSYF